MTEELQAAANAAFTAYWESRADDGGRFDRQPEPIQRAWRAAVKAVRQHDSGGKRKRHPEVEDYET